MIFPYRVIGMVEFKDASLNIIQADGSHRSIDFHLLKRMRVGLSISKEFVAGLSSYSNQRAYRLQIKGKEELVDLHCLNALYLTKADEQQFMSPPPTLINTLGVVRDTYKLRFYDLKGNESPLL